MDPMMRDTGKHSRTSEKAAGFTLIETMVAVLVLMVGVLSLAAMLTTGMAYMEMSQYDFIAQQKAAETVESIFTARNMGQATWDTICNVGSSVCAAGVFLATPTQLCDPGTDGIVGTADDNCTGLPDAILMPNASGNFNPPARAPLSSFRRTITITNAVTSGGVTIPNLRQIQVTITYDAGRFKRTYTMTSNISNFS
jgi:type II secretory pathway component PulJ